MRGHHGLRRRPHVPAELVPVPPAEQWAGDHADLVDQRDDSACIGRRDRHRPFLLDLPTFERPLGGIVVTAQEPLVDPPPVRPTEPHFAHTSARQVQFLDRRADRLTRTASGNPEQQDVHLR